jgi:hypothetical protein
MSNNGLDSPLKIQKLIERIYSFISKPNVPMKYLAVCAKKNEVWNRFYPDKISRQAMTILNLERASEANFQDI